MELWLSLWIPMILAAIVVWFWSFLSWAALDLHSRDTGKLPDEDAVMSALRQHNVPPGAYLFPKVTHKNSKEPEIKAKLERGPMGRLTVMGPFNVPGNLLATLGVYMLTSMLIGYVAAEALPRGAGGLKVFQIIGTVGVLTYGFASLPDMIWFQGRTHAKVMCVIDGLVQGLATGLVFALLWPK
jgi:hypothetical protein